MIFQNLWLFKFSFFVSSQIFVLFSVWNVVLWCGVLQTTLLWCGVISMPHHTIGMSSGKQLEFMSVRPIFKKCSLQQQLQYNYYYHYYLPAAQLWFCFWFQSLLLLACACLLLSSFALNQYMYVCTTAALAAALMCCFCSPRLQSLLNV